LAPGGGQIAYQSAKHAKKLKAWRVSKRMEYPDAHCSS
jgi:hypothetical protein